MTQQAERYFMVGPTTTHYSVADLKKEAMTSLKQHPCPEPGPRHYLKLEDYGITVGDTQAWGTLWVVGRCKYHNYQATHNVAI